MVHQQAISLDWYLGFLRLLRSPNMLSAAYGLMTTATAAAAGVVGVACFKNRLYTSVNNRIETDQLMDELHRRQGDMFALFERSYKSRWVPTLLLTAGYCASVEVHTSEYDVTQQSIEATVYLPCCFSWSSFTRRHLQSSSDDSTTDADSTDVQNKLPTKLPHAEPSSASLAWPDWSVEERLVFPPGTPDDELHQADAIAEHAKAILTSVQCASGLFVTSGAPGTGKTSAGLRLAQKLGPRTLVVRSYRPTQPGHMLSAIERVRKEFGDDGYIVVLLNEFDSWMDSFASGKGGMPSHPKLITEVLNKDMWNEWADSIHRRDRVVVWMTTNCSLQGYDPALLRPRRVTARYHVHDTTSFDLVFGPHVKVNVSVSDDDSSVSSDGSDLDDDSAYSPTELSAPLLQCIDRV